jgi:hypothetical protein
MVVDLAVEDDSDRAIGGPHWLRASGEIDDGQTPVSEMHPRGFLDPMPIGIRATMRNGVGHPLEIGAIPAPDEACYPAHAKRKRFLNVEIRKSGKISNEARFFPPFS